MQRLVLIVALTLGACNFRVGGLQGPVVGGPDLASPPIIGGGDDMAMAPVVTPDDMAMSTMPPAPGKDMAHTPPPPMDMAKAVGHLNGSVAGAPGTVNLSADGLTDWAHWGLNAGTDYDHKTTGGGLISDLTIVGGAGRTRYTQYPTTFTWSAGDGINDGNGNNDTSTTTGVYTLMGGYKITVPAGLTARRLIVYVSVYNVTGHLTASLGDNSAANYDDKSLAFTDSKPHDYAYTIDYAAASEGQTLTITWQLGPASGTLLSTPSVGINAATLQPQP